jgi:hypothetical protein
MLEDRAVVVLEIVVAPEPLGRNASLQLGHATESGDV